MAMVGRRAFGLGAAMAGLFAVLVGRPAFAQQLKPISAFRERVADLIRQRAPQLKLTFVGDDEIDLAGGAPSIASKMWVRNFYVQYETGAMSFDQAAEKLVVGLMTPHSAEPTRDDIVVIVRQADYIKGTGATWEVLTKPLGGTLSLWMAQDSETALAVAPAEKLRRLGLSDEALWALATANTSRRMGKLTIQSMDEGAWTITSANDLALSLICDDGFWSKPPVPLKGAPAVVAIQKNLLVVVDTGAKDTLARVKVWLTRLRNDPDTLSTTLLIREGGAWKEVSL